MIIENPAGRRECRTERVAADLVVVGGGLSGVCAAITAARAGLKVILAQDRPVLGGNASSEVRLWVLGATSHMGNNNRWAREGGVTDEILVENLYRNREGNAVIFDTVMLEKVTAEPNITLLLNTAVFEVAKADDDTIGSVRAFCPQNSTFYDLSAPLFCDASGDGIVGFLSGAAFRMGAESREEFGEGFAPDRAYGELLGHTIYFYSKDAGRPVRFTPPAYALTDISKIPRFRSIKASDFGCRFWWFEYGGRMDTVHDTETIKWELWKVVYGVWNYIKNSGQFPEAANLTLEWVGTIPGKRESRRFEGDYMIRQQDLIEQRTHDDAVSFGGWAIDLHPADGVYSEKPGCTQWHSKGVFQIPYRCLYSRNVRNLLLAGRTISASHVAFGSTRVMATSAHTAQAAGMAAAICRRRNLSPRDLASGAALRDLQRELARSGQYIPGVVSDDPGDLARRALVTASSDLRLAELPPDGPLRPLTYDWAMLLPVPAGAAPVATFTVDASADTDLELQLRVCSRLGSFTPDTVLERRTVRVAAGTNRPVEARFEARIDDPQYLFYCLMANPAVSARCSGRRVTGLVSAAQRYNPAVAKSAVQSPPEGIGVDTFEFWCPERRPGGHNPALRIEPALSGFGPGNVSNGVARPVTGPNAWVADPADPAPRLELAWDAPQAIREVVLGFDTDWDHPMESVLMGHPEDVMPFCVRRWRMLDGAGRELARCDDNHQTRNVVRFEPPVATDRLVIEVEHPSAEVPAALFDVRCYGGTPS